MAHTQMLEAYPKDLGGIDKDRLAECIAACFECAQMHEHCRICAEACRRCEDACRALIASL